jgi:hypothetical protein
VSIEIASKALLWCAAINYAILIVWVMLLTFPHEWFYRLSNKCFGVSVEQFNAVNFGGLALYKIGIILLNLVPYVALRIVGSS